MYFLPIRSTLRETVAFLCGNGHLPRSSRIMIRKAVHWFPRRTLSGNLVNTLLGCRLRAGQEALSDTGMGPSPLADPMHESTGEVFLRRGVLKRTCVDRLGARISVQLLDHLTCLLIATPQVARCRARFTNPIVGHSEVGVERLSRRTGCASTSRIRRSTRSPLEDSRPADSSRR